jgi:hypothetical protein
MRVLLLFVLALLCVSAQELELAWFGHDTVRAALARLLGTWRAGGVELAAACEVVAGTKPVVGLVPRGLRVDAHAAYAVERGGIQLAAALAHTSTHHLDSWAHKQRWGAIYGDWRMQLRLRLENAHGSAELGAECVPYRALFAPDYVLGLQRWWAFSRARLRAVVLEGRAWARAALDAEAAEFRFELGVVAGRLWAGLFAELLTHDWWEPARHAHACGIALRVQ